MEEKYRDALSERHERGKQPSIGIKGPAGPGRGRYVARRKALKTALEGMGMVVAGPAANTAEADRLVAEEIPHLALVDVNLKGEMAYGLIDRMHDRGVPVVVVSGYAVLASSAQKAAAILQKPFSGPELQATLCQVMNLGRAH